MGDISDMMRDGTLCQVCGTAMTDLFPDDGSDQLKPAPGVPRTCVYCQTGKGDPGDPLPENVYSLSNKRSEKAYNAFNEVFGQSEPSEEYVTVTNKATGESRKVKTGLLLELITDEDEDGLLREAVSYNLIGLSFEQLATIIQTLTTAGLEMGIFGPQPNNKG